MEDVVPKYERNPPKYVWRSYPDFLKKLEGWWVNPDGEDYCPECFPKWLDKFEPEMRQITKEDSRRLDDSKGGYARNRRARDGWFVICNGENCQRQVFVPFKNPK